MVTMSTPQNPKLRKASKSLRPQADAVGTPPNGASRFGQKLNELEQTLDLVLTEDHSPLAEGLRSSHSRSVIAIGSGGSAVTAAYFARCRDTLGSALTRWTTPLDFTLGTEDISDTDVWLFSAGADNPDFRAALCAADARGARQIHVLTRRGDAPATLRSAETANLAVHVIPVASEKDSFLATHSLVGSVAALLLASNLASSDEVADVASRFRESAMEVLGPANQERLRRSVAQIGRNDLLLIVADPQLAAVATLIETSAWEASLCPVQLTDFRNFAHGRHSWIHHRADETYILSLFGHDSASVWEGMRALLPEGLPWAEIEFGNCGRFRNALGIVEGLALIDAIGAAVGVDPGKPGIGAFGKPLYEQDALDRLSRRLGSSLRQKRGARLERDDPDCAALCIYSAEDERLERFAKATIGGIVLDYDGTIVDTEKRGDPPAADIVAELVRLHNAGVRVSIATGRGGSAGERLREVLPAAMHPHVLVGYYNGGYIRTLDVDIRTQPPEDHAGILETATWLVARNDLFSTSFGGEHSHVQISIQMSCLRDPGGFERALSACPPVAAGSVRSRRSGHSFDIVPAHSSKCSVADRVGAELPADVVILRVGDQGSRIGNDHEMLTHPFGISVQEVCGRDDGSWSLFGTELTGPDALLRLLKALKPDSNQCVYIDMSSLGLDNGRT